MMKALLCLNGKNPSKKVIDHIDLSRFDFVVCADGAYDYARHFCTPDLVIGDFDSCRGLPEGVEYIRYEEDKDQTDGELCVRYLIEAGCKNLTVIGADGGRDDQYFANVFLLNICLDSKLTARIVTDSCEIVLSEGGRYECKPGATVSLLPFGGDAHINSTEGLKYSIFERKLTNLHTLSVSNVALGDSFSVCVSSGKLLIFLSY